MAPFDVIVVIRDPRPQGTGAEAERIYAELASEGWT